LKSYLEPDVEYSQLFSKEEYSGDKTSDIMIFQWIFDERATAPRRIYFF